MEEGGEVERVGRRMCATEQLVQCAVRPIQKPWVPFHQRGPLLCARKVTAEYIVGDTQARTSSFCNSRSRRRAAEYLWQISFSRADPPTNDSGKRISGNRDVAASALPLFLLSFLPLCRSLSFSAALFPLRVSGPWSSTIPANCNRSFRRETSGLRYDDTLLFRASGGKSSDNDMEKVVGR